MANLWNEIAELADFNKVNYLVLWFLIGFTLLIFKVTGLNSQLEVAESLFCLGDKFNLSNIPIVRDCN